MKNAAFAYIRSIGSNLKEMSDKIFDNPETGLNEYQASALLCDWLEQEGFAIERGVGGLPTAFRAVYQQGEDGLSIGLLCEYDALDKMGHACAHHLQGPCILAAANSIKRSDISKPFKLVVYGTPAEETVSGKIIMLKGGCFQDIDVALMMHGGATTTVDVKSLANYLVEVEFFGTSSHAAIQPEMGRSALDSLLIAFQGVEFLREHIPDDVRIHYAIRSSSDQPVNVVPDYAKALFSIRSNNVLTLDAVLARFHNIMEGAALMMGTKHTVTIKKQVANKIPSRRLNQVLVDNAKAINAPTIRPPRERTGSTDFGNIMQLIPGSCIRVAFVPEGTPSHSQGFLDAGKSEAATEAMIVGAQVLAGAALDIIQIDGLWEEIYQDYEQEKNTLQKEVIN
ncbi:MAG: M20 family metallopeptidase [Christensenellaceae bacterium]|nr:M20 family metallopeptidase [Christensenellaceae bacterium]